MKKIICILLSVATIIFLTESYAHAGDNALITDGAYVQLGKYDSEPILWRCVSTDDNGKLIVSDRIICYKAFDSPRDKEYQTGSGLWEDSNIRTWLNSKENGSNIVWPGKNPPNGQLWFGYDASGNGNINFAYDNEDGFLNETNFTNTELSAIKSVSQWYILTPSNADKATNGVEYFFNTQFNSATRQHQGSSGYSDISQFSHIEGAMYKVVDTMFLLDEIQVYSLWEKYDAYSEPTEKALRKFEESFNVSPYYTELYNPSQYWLRTNGHAVYNSSNYTSESPSHALGIRPAFYLNEDNVKVISGSGAWNDPYVIDGYGQEGITVFSQGKQLEFDQQPIMENDRLLVPVRAIFESLGATVEYDEGDRVITANDGEHTVVMQIDNTEMGNGTEVITLDVAPRIIGERTMVPLRAVSESFGATVEYIDNLERVVIDVPQPQDFGDGYGLENWQQLRAIANGTYYGNLFE